MMTRKVGRPKTIDAPQSMKNILLDEAAYNHVLDFIARFEKEHGVTLSRSSALRKIIGEHKALTEQAA